MIDDRFPKYIPRCVIREPELVFTGKTPPRYLCPTCLSILDDWLKEKRCPDCGQKLIWKHE